jgi:hypothetical protein
MTTDPGVRCVNHSDYGAFVPSELDDYGLDVYEFRAYGHVSRRAGKGGECYEGHENMAKVCKMSTNKMRDALDCLVAAGVLERIPPSPERRTYTYATLHHSNWVSASKLPELRRQVTAHRKDRRRPRAALDGVTPNGSGTSTGSATPNGSGTSTPNGSEGGTPAGSVTSTPTGSVRQRYSHEGNPSEGTPTEGNPPNPPEGGTRSPQEEISESEALNSGVSQPSAQQVVSEPPKSSGKAKSSRRRSKKADVTLQREEQFKALLGWCKKVVYDRHAPGRFGDVREARARFAELEESDFLGYGYDVFKQGITAFAKGLDANPDQGIPDIERLILSRQRRTPYWEAAYMLANGLIPGEGEAEEFAPLQTTAATYQRSEESVDAELRQNYLPHLDPSDRVDDSGRTVRGDGICRPSS